MPGDLVLIEGPGGGGKSAVAERMVAAGEAAILADMTLLWAAIRGLRRDERGRFPVREGDDPALPVAQYLRGVAVAEGLRRGLPVVVTSATPDMAPKWASAAAREGATFSVRTIDPGEQLVRQRLAEFGGSPDALDPECEFVVGRWYG